jgi:hypothetical protein
VRQPALPDHRLECANRYFFAKLMWCHINEIDRFSNHTAPTLVASPLVPNAFKTMLGDYGYEITVRAD